IDRYVDFLRMRHYSRGTIANYRRSLRSLSTGLAAPAEQEKALTPVDVTTGALYNHLAAVSEEGNLSPRTLNWLVCTYSSFFRYLVTQGAVESNPVDRIERPKVGR